MNTTKLAGKISSCLLRIQLRFAVLMNKRASGCGPRKLKLIFALFVIFYCSLSTLVIIRTLTVKKTHSSFSPQHIKINRALPSRHPPSTIVTKELYERLLQLRRDHERSGLVLSQGMLDSIAQLEKIYLNQ